MRPRAEVRVGDTVRVAGVPVSCPVVDVVHHSDGSVTITYTIPGGGTYSSTDSGRRLLA